MAASTNKERTPTMKKHTIIAALLVMAALTMKAELITGTVAVPSGTNTATTVVTLNRSASWRTYAIDAFVINSAAPVATTGTVSIAAADIGVVRSLATAFTVAPASTSTVYPIRTYSGAGYTNTVPYLAHTFRVSITQNTTNAAVYTFGVITQ